MVSGGSTRILRAAFLGRFVLEKKPKTIPLCWDFRGFAQSQRLKFVACIKISYLNVIPPPTVSSICKKMHFHHRVQYMNTLKAYCTILEGNPG